MEIIANILGLMAVAMFVISYQFKSRKALIICNAGSRLLYILQYILLGALTGAVLDMIAFAISVIFERRKCGIISRHPRLTLALCYGVVAAAGALTYDGPWSLAPILGVVFETLALWLTRERSIRLLSLLGAPPWFAYNIKNAAYASALGNVITLVSIGIAILRYDILKKEKPTTDSNTDIQNNSSTEK